MCGAHSGMWEYESTFRNPTRRKGSELGACMTISFYSCQFSVLGCQLKEVSDVRQNPLALITFPHIVDPGRAVLDKTQSAL